MALVRRDAQPHLRPGLRSCARQPRPHGASNGSNLPFDGADGLTYHRECLALAIILMQFASGADGDELDTPSPAEPGYLFDRLIGSRAFRPSICEDYQVRFGMPAFKGQ